MEKQLRQITVSEEGRIKLIFAEVAHIASENQGEDSEEDFVDVNEFTVKSMHLPHKDLLESMKKLRKFALESQEIEITTKELTTWNVSGVKISGDVLEKKSRVVLTLSKKVKRTGKFIHFSTGQVTMYPEKEDASAYHNADKMTVIIEDLIEECWSYLDGTKTGEEKKKGVVQMPLFPDRTAEAA